MRSFGLRRSKASVPQSVRWAGQGSNLQPTRYERDALPLSYRPEMNKLLLTHYYEGTYHCLWSCALNHFVMAVGLCFIGGRATDGSAPSNLASDPSPVSVGW